MSTIAARIDSFLGWWGGELRSAIGPALTFAPWAADGEVVLVGPGGSNFQRAGAASGQARAASALEIAETLNSDGAGRAVTLRLAAVDALQLDIEIPSRAIDRVREVLALEIESATPFTPAEVTFDFIAGKETRSGARVVRQYIVKNDFLAQLVDAFDRAGVVIGRIDVEGAEGINLLPRAARRRRRILLRAHHGALLAALVLLAAGAAYGQGRAIRDLESRKDALVRDTAAVRAAAADANAAAANITALATRFSDNPPALHALASLTDALDDSVWLTELSIAGGALSISGSASSASNALAALEASPAFEAAEFTSTVFTDRTTNSETFSARMKFQPPASAPSSGANGQ